MNDLRQRIVTEARSWIGTPWRHQASVKGVGCDCIGLVRGVIIGCGLATRAIAQWHGCNYSRTPDGAALKAALDEHLTPVALADLQPADMVLFAIDVHPQHLGIVAPYRHGTHSIIHASSRPGRAGSVVETRLMFSRRLRFVAGYALPGVD